LTLHIVNRLLPKLAEECDQLLPGGFIFQQDGAPQERLLANCPKSTRWDQ